MVNAWNYRQSKQPEATSKKMARRDSRAAGAAPLEGCPCCPSPSPPWRQCERETAARGTGAGRLTSTQDDHRDLGVSQYLGGFASQHHARKTSVSVRRHADRIAAIGFRAHDDLLPYVFTGARHAGAGNVQLTGRCGDSIEDLLVERRGVLLALLTRGGEGGRCDRQHVKRRRHMKRHDFASKRPAQCQPLAHCLIGKTRTVGRDEYRLEHTTPFC